MQNARSEGSSVGVQDRGALTEGTERVKTTDLLTVVNDPAVTMRTLEYWRHEGLLPAAERTGQHGKRPEWTYPVGAIDQLTALQRLRRKTKEPHLLRAALWFDGYPIDVERVRFSIAAVLQRALDSMTREIEKRRDPTATGEEANWAVLEVVGRTLARKRGANAPPRYGRQSQAERERALSLALGLVLGDPGASARLEQDAARVERMIGLDRGRRSRGGLPAWLDGPPDEGLQGFANVGSLPALIEAMKTATDEELTASRRLARIMLDGISAFAHRRCIHRHRQRVRIRGHRHLSRRSDGLGLVGVVRHRSRALQPTERGASVGHRLVEPTGLASRRARSGTRSPWRGRTAGSTERAR